MKPLTAMADQNDEAETGVSALLASGYPELAAITEPGWLEILGRARVMQVPPKFTLLMENSQCNDFLFLLAGNIRIYQLSEDGREITLYHINPGDTCVMSLNSLLTSQPFKANAQTVTGISAMSISLPDFRMAMEVSEVFRQYVLKNLTENFCKMMNAVRHTVFDRLEVRLACLLGRLFERAQSETLKITHMELANELGTTREVISRILKQLEREGCIQLSRGQIQIASDKQLQWFSVSP